MKKLFIIVLLLSVLVTALNVFKNDSRQVSDIEKNSKEYFYDQESKIFSFERISRKVFSQLASLFTLSRRTILLPITFKKQEHRVTCEVASLRMSLDYLGIDITEDELLKQINVSTSSPRTKDNFWGDPHMGFVGDFDGSIFFGTGYGVYDYPIMNLARMYTKADTLDNPSISEVLEHVKSGSPVIVWGLLSSKYTINWTSHEGKQVKAFPGEHSRIVIGYTGNISNPENIILMDPLYGIVQIETSLFLEEWRMLDNMAVVVG